MNNPIKTTVQFSEQTAIPKEQSENVLFDIYIEDISGNTEYCKALIEKLLTVPYAKLPEFFTHHCNFISDPIKWLNKTERLISINEGVFCNSSGQGRMIKCYTIIESKRKELELLRYRHSHQKASNAIY